MLLTRFVRQFLCLILLCLILPMCARGQENRSAQSQIKATYSTYIHSDDIKDMDALLSTVTSDFQFTETDGTVHDIKFFKKAALEDFKATKSVSTHRTDINSIVVNGDEARTVATETHYWIAAYEPGPQHTYQEIITSQDTWIRTISGWKMQRSKWTSDTITKDGVSIAASSILSDGSSGLLVRSALVTVLGLLALIAGFIIYKTKKYIAVSTPR